MNYCFGVDIGGTTVKLGLFQEDGKLQEKWEIKTRIEDKGSRILPDIAESLMDCLEKNGIRKKRWLESVSAYRRRLRKRGL